MTSRERFEAWAVTNHWAIHRNGGDQYVNTPTQHAWLGWQAREESLDVEAAKERSRDFASLMTDEIVAILDAAKGDE
jgi:hypothetical protein